MVTFVVAKAFLLNSKGEFLALRRSETAPRRALEWDLPGGGVDPGESFDVAVAREVSEETGIELGHTALEIVYAQTGLHDNKNIIFLYYMAQRISDEVKISNEHDKFQWFSFEDGVTVFNYDRQIEAMHHITDNGLIPD